MSQTGQSAGSNPNSSNRAPPRPSASQLAAAAAIVGTSTSSPATHEEVSDSEMEDAVILKDGRRFPTAERQKNVGFWQLLAIIYFCVEQGPYGIENGILAGGITWVLILLVLLPWVFHLPHGLLTSELASAMPQNGGYIIWVNRAFGRFWGFQEGWLSWTSSLSDTALYPFLIVAYLNNFLVTYCDVTLSSWSLYAIRVSLCFMVMIFNLWNLQLHGTIALVFGAICLSPFFLLTFIGFPEINWNNAVRSLHPVAEVNFGLMMSVVLWATSGFDSPGTVAGDVQSPKKTYPRAVLTAVTLVMLTNLLPVLVAASVEKRYETFVSGNAFWASVGYRVGGNWLQILVIIVAILGNLNFLHVLLTSSSWSLYAIALPGLLDMPSLTKLQSSFRTPYVCILLNSLGLFVCCLYTFAELVQVTMALHCLALMLQAASLVWLRITEPKMKRPYRIPFSYYGLTAFMFLPCAVAVLLLFTIDSTPQAIVFLLTLVGVILFFLTRCSERIEQKDDVEAPPVDIQNVFSDIIESVPDSKPDDEFPDLGFRSSLLTQQLPESIRSEPNEINDNRDDVDHLEAEQQKYSNESDGSEADGDEEDDEEKEEDKLQRQVPITPLMGIKEHEYGSMDKRDLLPAVQE